MATRQKKSGMEVLSRNLFLLRQSLGLQQKDVAGKLGVTPQTLNRYEKGVHSPDTEMLGRIADFYNVSIDYLLGRVNEGESKVNSPENKRLISNFSDQNEYGEWLKHPRELRQLAMDLLDRARQAKQEKEK